MDEHDEEGLTYTLEEATELLPEVRRIVGSLQRVWMEAGSERQAFEDAQTSSRRTPVEVSLAHQALVAALWDVQPLVAWLRSRNIVLRDPATGLIDFPSEIDGDEVFLCWRLGEDSIDYWHGRDEGFDNRKPLPPDA